MIQKNIELIVENITELIISCQADKFVINGGLKSGKSHALNMLQKELTKEPYSVLYLGENINTSFYMEYGVFSIPLSNTNYKGKKLKEGIRSSIALFCESSSALTQFLSSLDTLSIELISLKFESNFSYEDSLNISVLSNFFASSYILSRLV